MIPLILSLSIVASAQPSGHEAQNTLYRTMLDPGLVVGPNVKVKLPAPLIADGLDAAKQKAIITELIGNDYSYEDFTRKSVVAPHILRIRDIVESTAQSPVRGLDTYFVGYVDLKKFEDEKFLDRSLNSGKGEGKSKNLTGKDLAKRGIELKPDDEKREGYGTVEFDFLDKVRLQMTGHAISSKTAESIIACAEVDPRFRDDKEFPNAWQSLTKEGGELKVGAAQPYGGAGIYIKITKLADIPGAVFVEQHIVYSEPVGWFEGTNLLRSKLPPAIQVNVRNIRKEWVKTAGK